MHHQANYHQYFALKHQSRQKRAQEGPDEDNAGDPSVGIGHVLDGCCASLRFGSAVGFAVKVFWSWPITIESVFVTSWTRSGNG